MLRIKPDIAVFGGGIAGLWTLARLRKAGYKAILFEAHALGGVQSIASQGIIHGGTKYALTGKLTQSAAAIADMPRLWRSCLEGTGELDLSTVRVLSEYQYLWSTESVTSKLAGFFAGKLMRSRIGPLGKGERPAPFDDVDFAGNLYRLQEPVLDTHSLMQALQQQLGEYCYQVASNTLIVPDRGKTGFQLNSDNELIEVQPARVILAAGAGNQSLLERWGRTTPAMQTRPLHMLMVKGDLPLLYAHCLGASANPRMTLTSYRMSDGEVVWYVGGQVAEEGVSRSTELQIEAGKAELGLLLPWMDSRNTTWSTLRIDRAEPQTRGGSRPDDCFVHSEGGLLTVWPTKLAFAPRVAQAALDILQREVIQPAAEDEVLPDSLRQMNLSRQPWEIVEQWN